FDIEPHRLKLRALRPAHNRANLESVARAASRRQQSHRTNASAHLRARKRVSASQKSSRDLLKQFTRMRRSDAARAFATRGCPQPRMRLQAKARTGGHGWSRVICEGVSTMAKIVRLPVPVSRTEAEHA